ncbi:MAG: M16 family metallopeptidase [Pyrinomonadaceae bacterium]
MSKTLFTSVFLISLLFQMGPAFGQKAASARPAAAQAARATAAAPAAHYETPFVNKTLPNGLEVIVLPDSAVPLVTVELAVRNGSFTEPPELNGLSHLFEHMFFKPSQAAYRGADYLKNIETLGIAYNGSTREEIVNYYFTTTSPYVKTAMQVINDAVRLPRFDEQEFAKEKQVVIGELERNESNPFYYLSRELSDRLFYKYPTRKNPAGTRETVAKATTDQMRTIKSRYYFPNNAALIVAGDVKPDEIFTQAEQILGSWEPRKVDPFKEFPLVEHPPLPKSEGVIIEKTLGDEQQTTEQNVFIQVGWQGPSIGKDDKATYAADVFSYILQQPDSRFQRDLVDSGLASGASLNYYTQRNVGPITLFLITTPEKAKAAVKAAYAEIAQFTDPKYFTAEELENSKTILQASDLFDREKTSEYAHTLGFWWSSTGIDYFRGYQKNLRATNRTDINQYVSTYIQGKPHVGIALLSPAAKSAANLSELDLTGGK